MSELAVIIDMDKTVVPTWDFISDVAQALDDGFGVPKDQFYNDVDGLHVAGVVTYVIMTSSRMSANGGSMLMRLRITSFVFLVNVITSMMMSRSS